MKPKNSYSDCREPDGILIGLVDTVINSARILKRLIGTNELSPDFKEALKDLNEDEDVLFLINIARTPED